MESRLLLPVVGLGLAAGALGAGITLFLQPPAPQTIVSAPEGIHAMEERLEALDQSMQQQLAEFDALGGRLARLDIDRVDLDAPTREEFDRLLSRLDGIGEAASIGMFLPSESGLHAAIDGVLVQREELQRQEKEEKRREKDRKRIERDVNRWSERLMLTPIQAEEMIVLMESRANGQTEIRQAIDAGEMDKRGARRPWQNLDEAYESGLTSLFTPVQMEQYRQATTKR